VGDGVSGDPTDSAAADDDGAGGVTVYWRPGCPFCMSLKAGLRRSHVPFRQVNIWSDPQAAMFVRSVAGGNETVPTVTVGDVALVNPPAGTVKQLAVDAGLMDATTRRGWFGLRR
jgi:mycoredoxin